MTTGIQPPASPSRILTRNAVLALFVSLFNACASCGGAPVSEGIAHPGYDGIDLSEGLPDYDNEEASPPRDNAHRDPAAARRNAMFFPGGGQFYSGESTRGAMLLAGSAGALVAGVLLSSGKGSCDATGPDPNCVYNPKTHMEEGKPANRTPMLIGSSAALLLWGYGVLDAPKSAARVNGRNGFSVGPTRLFPEPVLALDRDGSPEAGLRLRVAW